MPSKINLTSEEIDDIIDKFVNHKWTRTKLAKHYGVGVTFLSDFLFKRNIDQENYQDLIGEVWKNVEGYEEYQISNFSRVRTCFNNSGRTNSGFKLMEGTINNGYLRVCLRKGIKKTYHLVHRLAAKAFIPNIEFKPMVNHIDGNKLNNNLTNLEWCTCKENNIHACKTGLNPGNGGKHKQKLYKKVYCVNTGEIFKSRKEAADRYGYCLHTISRLIKNKIPSETGLEFRHIK